MLIELTYDGEQNEYCIYRGCDLILHTESYAVASKKFNTLCDQARSIDE